MAAKLLSWVESGGVANEHKQFEAIPQGIPGRVLSHIYKDASDFRTPRLLGPKGRQIIAPTV